MGCLPKLRFEREKKTSFGCEIDENLGIVRQIKGTNKKNICAYGDNMGAITLTIWNGERNLHATKQYFTGETNKCSKNVENIPRDVIHMGTSIVLGWNMRSIFLA